MRDNADLNQHLILIEERLSAIEGLQNPGALSLIAQRLSAIDARLAERVPVSEIRKAIEDIFATWGQVSQLREVYTTQRDELAALVQIAAQLAGDARAHDATGVEERETIHALLVQLSEIGRKHVTGLTDLERALNWRAGDAERRKGQ